MQLQEARTCLMTREPHVRHRNYQRPPKLRTTGAINSTQPASSSEVQQAQEQANAQEYFTMDTKRGASSVTESCLPAVTPSCSVQMQARPSLVQRSVTVPPNNVMCQ